MNAQTVAGVEAFLTDERPDLAEYVLRYVANHSYRLSGIPAEEVFSGEWTLCDGINWIMDTIDPNFDFTRIARYFG